ncbi:MAG: transcription termination/antitermination protein NusA [Bacteroidales bacterium]|nr:transcription termination/antitermination protein NusA [Bacteroidales bacterium]
MEAKTDLKDAFAEFKKQKNIDRNTMMGVLEDVFKTQLAKTYGSADNFDVIVNVDRGDCEIYQTFEVVDEVENPVTQITVEQLKAMGEDDFEVGDEYVKKLSMADFGRRGILNLRQNLQGRIMDIERANLYNAYLAKKGQLVTGEAYQSWNKEVLILDEDHNELHLPKSEQIPGEHFKKGDVIRAIIKDVEMKNNSTPYIVLSRTSDEFLERLFEQEVPEIYDGLITIKKVVRIPGERAKVAVESYDERIDPIGACIGVKGARIIGIVKELRNENIDVIQWTSNTQLLIQRALNPAKISSIVMDPEEDKIKVYMHPDEVKKGIGKGGCNIRLAGMLVGKEIEVWRDVPARGDEEEDDVLLSEFSNDNADNEEYGNGIDQWIIERLQAIGCDTAKSVLAQSPEDIARRADLEDETVAEVFDILRAEFED